MSNTIDDIEDDIGLENYDIGRRAYFINPYEDPDKVLMFASEIHLIGKVWDRQMKNHTEVLIVSEKASAYHPTRGALTVIKVMHTESMWVPIDLVVIIKEKL